MGPLTRRAAGAVPLALALALTVCAVPGGHRGTPRTATAPPAAGCPDGDGAVDPSWAPTATRIDPADSYHAFVGNGYLGQRVPPLGAGYWAGTARTGWPLFTPRYDGSFVAGLYAREKSVTSGRQVIAALPTWTPLTVGVGADTFSSGTPAGRVSGYRQTLWLRCGLVRTSLTWTASDGRVTGLVLDVLADRADPHVGAVRLRMTPRWNGESTVTDLIDGRGARMLRPRPAAGPGGANRVSFRTLGTGVAGSVVSVLRPGPEVAARPVRPADGAAPLTGRRAVTFPVRAGRTYTFTKYVGVDTALTAPDPDAGARAAAVRAARLGWPALLAEQARRWARLWRSGVEVPGRPELTGWVRASEYGLLSSLRAGAADSVAPTGLTSDNYAGLVFWDAETWMFPSLLAFHPRLARSVVEYRYRTRKAARANARRLGYRGLFYSWESGSSGDLRTECQSWQPPHCVTQIHLQSDIALAVWQYYLATGDLGWLRGHGWPVLSGVARFWAGRATRDPDGGYSVRNVAGPDEYSNGVTDGAFTNAGAATALRAAVRAARLLGRPAPAAWTRIADRLRVPFDRSRDIFEQYAGYHGSLIKQADTVMLLYPLNWPMPPGAARATLAYYAARTDPDGPAMTDSVHAVDAAVVGAPGCATYTYLRRSVEPFVRGPFDEFSEARGAKAGAADPLAGAPAQDFLTGAGGFLQTFPAGLGGLRWQADGVRLDPSLPPQLADGVVLRGLRWRGRAFDVAIGAHTTTVRLTGGGPMTVYGPQGAQVVSAGVPLVLKTRRPDLAPTDDAARCRPASADSEQPGRYADAAVDGSPETAWVPAAPRATLTVDLGRTVPVSRITTRWTAVRPASSTVALSPDGTHWRPVSPGAGGRLPVTWPARFVRVTVRAADAHERPGLAELTAGQAASGPWRRTTPVPRWARTAGVLSAEGRTPVTAGRVARR
ncbi:MULTISPECIES: discoidin domain-containing protein [Streptomycetaceae]|uniref:F5/8 type C domain-containing protein n=1 Tax=Streptantibioticus cattleyicolor (strain ATCC 35852 / DSM 46488 / JCM 4925 / NBRC 14057 / NRRL 8057) TaxID=1003195 RepID=F8JRM1_STREN|nr:MULTISPECIES: discoidin domain-containing protein [Streptomycetaceae]AEW97906.1 hypothetical protein SCATT_55350 [Streptantibioticus cattleyicolor NRRL 8057 = DSM 46488]MYS62312.1 haloacid dehalogenase [Streptomyces sp. SID5468]CCB78222.1 conserved exported protein of unknown function [Streptantibioticus cattleyicolor NRRL 8057 = DSM 46488]